jgi:MauM/NapG family ferredoxin protein
MKCVGVCPNNANPVVPGVSKIVWKSYDPHRRDFLTTGISAIIAFTFLRLNRSSSSSNPFLLRPPGCNDESLLSTCIRCGVCLKVCPTNALQPSIYQTNNLEGLFTPILTPRSGYCDYSCNLCGTVCPVGAIPQLSLEQKRITVIGKAVIDTNRCIAWADHKNCIVCEEMCPLPEKAIWLENKEFLSQDGSSIRVQVPNVTANLCIGCGICEYKCPVSIQAAIQVYLTDTHG